MAQKEILNRIHELEVELQTLRKQLRSESTGPETVVVPDQVSDLFHAIEKKVETHFEDVFFDPYSGEITVHGQRYVMFRAGSMGLNSWNSLRTDIVTDPKMKP